MPNGAELFVRSIKELGITQIFTLVGDHLNEVLSVAAREGIRVLDMRHESGVTHAADAWARGITRKPALSLVTVGPGHTNSLTGIATANLAASPLIAVSGSRATNVGDRGAFQDIDQVGMAKPVSKWAAEPPSAAQIPSISAGAHRGGLERTQGGSAFDHPGRSLRLLPRPTRQPLLPQPRMRMQRQAPELM